MRNADVALLPGRNGVFDIQIDGAPVFSKKLTGRFPTDDELKSIFS